MSANARQLISRTLALLVAALLPAHATVDLNASNVYFVAATPPQGDSPNSYPAALYSTGEKGKLLLIRQLFTADQHFRNFADDLHGRMYLAGDKGVFIIHEGDPTEQDFVALEDFDDYLCWGAVNGDQLPPGIQYCDGDKLTRVLGIGQGEKPRVGQGDWAAFKFLQYGGENGGPFQMQPPLAEVAGHNVVMPYSIRPNVVIGELPQEFETPAAKRRTAVIVASTDRYLALWILPDYMKGHSIDASNPDHAQPLQLLIFHRLDRRWQKLEVPTTVTSLTHPPVRVFGDWLATLVMNWKAEPRESGGQVFEHGRPPLPKPELPDVASEFLNRFSHLSIPGKLMLQNLANNRRLVLDTGQEDSEILAIRDDAEILYRVNDSIYLAKIVGDQISGSALVAKDTQVPEVHWAFWGPGPKNGKSATNPRRSD